MNRIKVESQRVLDLICPSTVVVQLIKIRTRVSAIVIKNGKIMLIKRIKPDGEYFTFPGGGVVDGENNTDAVVRELNEDP